MPDQTSAEGGYLKYRRDRKVPRVKGPFKSDTALPPNMGTKKKRLAESLGRAYRETRS